jgi:ribose transport system permease protein
MNTESTAPAPRTADRVGRAGLRDLRGFIARYGVIIALLLIPIGFSIAEPATYFTLSNFETILSTQSVRVFLTLGLTMALVVNELDLSVGAVLGFSSTLIAVLTVKDGIALGPAIGICLVAGLAIGLIHALLIVRVGVNSFITTLGTGTVLLGLTLLISNSTIISGIPRSLVSAVSGTTVFGLSLSVYYVLALAIVLWYLYEYTPIGRYMYFVGFGRGAARLSGVSVGRIRGGALIGCALIATVAGILQAGTLGGTDPTSGQQFLLPAFAGGFLGATTIKVGRFNAWGSLLAVYLLACGITGLSVVGLSGWVEQVFYGSALVLAVVFATLVGGVKEVEE